MSDVESLSISNTKRSLISVLQNIPGLNLDFITERTLSRPPFEFIHTIVRILVGKLGFAPFLYTETTELNPQIRFTKRDKIAFLIKLTSVVTAITGTAVDLYVSPAKIISGKDVLLTQNLQSVLAIL